MTQPPSQDPLNPLRLIFDITPAWWGKRSSASPRAFFEDVTDLAGGLAQMQSYASGSREFLSSIRELRLSPQRAEVECVDLRRTASEKGPDFSLGGDRAILVYELSHKLPVAHEMRHQRAPQERPDPWLQNPVEIIMGLHGAKGSAKLSIDFEKPVNMGGSTPGYAATITLKDTMFVPLDVVWTGSPRSGRLIHNGTVDTELADDLERAMLYHCVCRGVDEQLRRDRTVSPAPALDLPCSAVETRGDRRVAIFPAPPGLNLLKLILHTPQFDVIINDNSGSCRYGSVRKFGYNGPLAQIEGVINEGDDLSPLALLLDRKRIKLWLRIEDGAIRSAQASWTERPSATE